MSMAELLPLKVYPFILFTYWSFGSRISNTFVHVCLYKLIHILDPFTLHGILNRLTSVQILCLQVKLDGFDSVYYYSNELIFCRFIYV